MWNEIKLVISQIINLRDTTDVKGTIDSIRKGIQIKGYNVWILACGAMLASIGLDQNSVAVIIGAMLISPLMSPILGIGLSVGINDRENLALALENFFIAVVASLGVSIIYFLITPFGDYTKQIEARTEPTILDVLVAIFGGIAGIVATSRKEKTNAIPGVAIATALMPPICVAGYGIANWKPSVIFGASYLFFMNAVFIALSTYLLVRYLRFPYVDYLNETTRRKAVRWVTFIVILAVSPSGYFFYNLVQKRRFERNVTDFIDKEINTNRHMVSKYILPKDTAKLITFYMAGTKISKETQDSIVAHLPAYKLASYRLNFLQTDLDQEEVKTGAYYEILKAVEPRFTEMESQQDSLEEMFISMQADDEDLASLTGFIRKRYPDIRYLSLALEAMPVISEAKQDTCPVVIVTWKRGVRTSTMRQGEASLDALLRYELGADTLIMVRRP